MVICRSFNPKTNQYWPSMESNQNKPRWYKGRADQKCKNMSLEMSVFLVQKELFISCWQRQRGLETGRVKRPRLPKYRCVTKNAYGCISECWEGGGTSQVMPLNLSAQDTAATRCRHLECIESYHHQDIDNNRPLYAEKCLQSSKQALLTKV